MIRTHKAILITLLSMTLAACAGHRPSEITSLTGDTTPPDCHTLFTQLQQAVTGHGVQDVQAARIQGFANLRVNRLLASLAQEPLEQLMLTAWLTRLQALAQQGWEIEVANLPASQRAHLTALQTNDGDLPRRISSCGQQLLAEQLHNAAAIQTLRQRARVPDAYRGWRRVVGLYPLVALPTAYGIRDWHQQTQYIYATPVEQLPLAGQLQRFQPPPAQTLTTTEVRELLRRSADNALGIPEPTGVNRERLFASFAPSWEVDVVADTDRIGTATWRVGETRPVIDIATPVVYRHLSHTRFDGQILLQLNYIVWFPARPRRSAFDLLGGHIDGITWRVTLAPNGEVLLYDSMHNCGCYHMFFPGNTLVAKPNPGLYQENPLIPQTAPAIDAARGLVVRVAHSTHYLQRITDSMSPAVQSMNYRWQEYDALRSLAVDQHRRRSLFDNNGIVPGSQRAERYVFWPLGVVAPGAMRQWGQHATAFLGRRHFDDPELIERYFQRAIPSTNP